MKRPTYSLDGVLTVNEARALEGLPPVDEVFPVLYSGRYIEERRCSYCGRPWSGRATCDGCGAAAGEKAVADPVRVVVRPPAVVADDVIPVVPPTRYRG